MNQELLVKMTKWVLYASVGVLVVAMFFVFFGDYAGRKNAGKDKDWATLGISEGTSLQMEGWANDSAGGGDGAVSRGIPEAETAPSAKMMSQEAQTFSETAPGVAGVPGADMEKRVVRNGNLSIRVEDAEWSADEIDRIVTRLGGFTSSRMMNGQEVYPMPMMRGGVEYDAPSQKMNAAGGNTIQSGTVTVKVPSAKFAEAVSEIKAIATVVINESSSASDVTAQFADLEAQIRNKRAEEEAFTKILNTNPGKVSDILEVTRELARVRGEIEQLETQKKYMESQTDMAEISVYLTEDAKVGAATDTWRPWQTVKDAMNQLLAKFQGFVDGVIYFVVSVLPFFLLYLLGLYVAYRVGRRVYLKMRGQ